MNLIISSFLSPFIYSKLHYDPQTKGHSLRMKEFFIELKEKESIKTSLSKW